MMNTEVTLELAQKALGLMAEESRGRVHADDVIKAVCTYYDVKPTLLKGTKRNAGIVNARQVTMYLLKKQLGMTYVDIGNLLGGKDHTTIMHGVDKIETLVEKKARVSEDITGIINTLHG
jgi:chromosomal replication initiator protein